MDYEAKNDIDRETDEDIKRRKENIKEVKRALNETSCEVLPHPGFLAINFIIIRVFSLTALPKQNKVDRRRSRKESPVQ